MNKALPWNVNGVGFDARDAAREAAHRQGKSLGEWLHGVIADHAADLGLDAEEMGGQQRIQAVTSKLEHLSARGLAEHERRARNGRAPEATRRRAAWDRDDEPDEASREAREQREPRRRREKPSNDSTEVLLEQAIEAMERRAARAEQRTDNALQSFTRLLERNEAERDRERDSVAVLAQKLTDMEARLADKLSNTAEDPISGALARLESRLETIGQRAEKAERLAAARIEPPRDESSRHVSSRSDESRPDSRQESRYDPRAESRRDDARPRREESALSRRLPARETSYEAEAGQKAPLTRLQAKLNSILGDTDARPASLAHAPSPRAFVERAAWMVERFDVPPPAAPAAPARVGPASLAPAVAGPFVPAPSVAAPIFQKPSVREPLAQAPLAQPVVQEPIAPQPVASAPEAPAAYAPPPVEAQAPVVAAPPSATITPFDAAIALLQAEPSAPTPAPVPALEPSHQAVAAPHPAIEPPTPAASTTSFVPFAVPDAPMPRPTSLASRLTPPRGVDAAAAGLDHASFADGSAALAAILGGNRRLGPAIAEITRRQRALDAESRSTMLPALRPAAGTPATLAQAETAHFSAMQSEIASLTGSIESLRLEVSEQRRDRSRRSAALDALKADANDLANKVKAMAESGGIAVLEASILSLADCVAISRAKSPQGKILASVEPIIGVLRAASGKFDASETLGGLEAKLRLLAGTLGGMTEEKADASDVAELQAQLTALRETIGTVDSRPQAVERLKTRIGALVARLERLRRHPNSRQDVRGDVDALRNLVADPQSDAYAKAKAQIEDIDALLSDIETGKTEDGARTSRSAFSALEQVVRDLADKLDAVQAPGAGVEALDALQRQIAEMADRFEQSQDGFTKLASIEESMQRLFDHMEATRSGIAEAQADGFVAASDPAHEALDALQRQVADIANRFEQSQDGLSKLAALEDSMQRLFDHIETTRSSVEDAAAHAAREVLRIALEEGRSKPSSEVKDPVEVVRGIEAEVAPRPQSVATVQGHVKDIVARISTMEAEIAEVRKDPAEPERPTLVAGRDMKATRIEPSRVEPTRADTAWTETAPATAAPSVLDQILGHRPGQEPSHASAKALVVETKSAPDGDEEGPADFIAAARRAAQVAQADLADLKRPGRTKTRKAVRAGLLRQSKDYVTRHKRPVLLSLAALFVAVGALSLIKLGTIEEGDSRVTEAKVLRQGSAIEASADVGGKTDSATKSRTSSTSMSPVAGTDPSPTGSVAPLPSFAAAALPRGSDKMPSIVSAALQSKASSGDSAAQYALGLQYAEGNGIMRDFAQAAHWYQKAADQNLAPAQYRLASLYEKGLGVTQDKAKAKALYLKAATAGNPRAMHNLAVLLADGDGKPDYDGAATWFRKAAQYGIHDSQYNLGILLARGIGVKQSLIQSYQWFAIAAAQGDTDAAKKRDEVGSRLRANDIAVASALASAFHARTADAAATEVPMPAAGWDSVQPPSPVNSPRPKVSAL